MAAIVTKTQAWLHLEYFVGDAGDLECVAGFVILPSADGEHLAANLPDGQMA